MPPPTRPRATPPPTTPNTSGPSSAPTAGCSSRCWPRRVSRSSTSPTSVACTAPTPASRLGEALEQVVVAVGHRRDDVGGDLRARGLAVPADRGRPVPQVLLVERVLRAAGLVLVRRPEPGGVGGEHLVGEDQRAVLGPAELKLG